MTNTMSWQHHAQQLFGDEWIVPLSDVLGINRRTVQRWHAGEGEPREAIKVELRRLACRSYSRAIGRVLRRMARGETLEDIQADYRGHVAATKVVQSELGRFGAIAILADRNEINEEEDHE